MTDSQFKFDRLKLYFGEPYYLGNGIEILQPSIGDIMKQGEGDFFSMLNVFISNPTGYRVPLWDNGIDWTEITDFQLFQQLVLAVPQSSSKVIFGDLDFTLFKVCSIQSEDGESEEVVLYNQPQDVLIKENDYLEMAQYLRTMVNIFPKVMKARGKFTKQSIIDEDKIKQKNDAKYGTKSDSILLPLISACVNHPGFKYNVQELRDVGIYQFMDSVSRIAVYEQARSLANGMYSGFADLSKIDKKLFDFMRDLTPQQK